MHIPLAKPEILESDIEAVAAVLRSSRLSQGPMMRAFETSLAAYLSVSHAVAVNSGTSALQLALLALQIQEGDEVILPSLSFMAVTNAVLAARAIPVYVDIEPGTLNMDPEKIESLIGSRTRAIIVVHSFGCAAQVEKIIAIAERYGLSVIEDACEAIGGEVNGRKLGTLGDVGIFAFYPNKQITTGEGGALVTNSSALAEKARCLSNQGRVPSSEWFQHAEAGYSYRLSDINCALGLQQLSRIDEILNRREGLARIYERYLRRDSDIHCYRANADSRTSWFAFPVLLPAGMRQVDRDEAWRELKQMGIETARYFPPAHLQPVMKNLPFRCGDLCETISVSQRLLCLPFFNSLQESEIEFVCDSLKRVVLNHTGAVQLHAVS
ncbi:MAG TPA: DegT/DnrJ/EryC1/StrS family aminotransferase [Candidatus Angelobacter sp.]